MKGFEKVIWEKLFPLVTGGHEFKSNTTIKERERLGEFASQTEGY